VGDARTLLRREKDPAAPAEVLGRAAGELFSLLRGPATERRRFYPGRLGPELGERVEALSGALERLRQALGEGEGEADERALLARRCLELGRSLRFLAAADDPAHVYWTEPRGRGMLLASVPIDLAPVLGERLFADCGVALTSATLSVEGSFDFVRERLGISEAEELLLPSPFDHARQAVLYLPPRMPDPSAGDFLPRAVEEIVGLLGITRGRALLLFTSRANLGAAAEALKERVDYPLLVQGEAPQRVLLERLRSEPGTVLLGTNSFRQGVDVPGEALSLVVLDRLPFSVPDEPLVAARGEDLRRQGRNPFTAYQLPTAVIALKQALGRLLRHSRDRGVLAVMDPRLRTRRYGRVFLDSLPPHPVVGDLEEVRRFFGGPGPG
jgi:ATP-dependent DNA helicase DinG